MAHSIPGGAFVAPDGKTWHDSEGRPLKPADIAAAQKLYAANAAESAKTEKVRATAEARAHNMILVQATPEQAGLLDPEPPEATPPAPPAKTR